MVSLIAGIIVGVAFSKVGKRIWRKTDVYEIREGRKAKYHSNEWVDVVALVLGGLTWWFLPIVLAQEIPGAYFEKGEYKREFYVNLFPDGSDSKNYRVPAMIFAYIQDYPASGDDNGGSERKYAIESARFPNGGAITFSDGVELELGDKVNARDDSGRWWAVELTSEPVKRK